MYSLYRYFTENPSASTKKAFLTNDIELINNSVLAEEFGRAAARITRAGNESHPVYYEPGIFVDSEDLIKVGPGGDFDTYVIDYGKVYKKYASPPYSGLEVLGKTIGGGA